MDAPPRFVVVELYDDAELTAQEAAGELLEAVEEVKAAYPARDDGYGRLVMVGYRRERQ